MKLRHSIAIFTLIIIFAGISSALTMGNWQGAPDSDANKPAGTGNWTDPYWNKPPVALPAAPGTPGAEIKIIKPGASCTINSNVGTYDCKISIGGGADLATAPKLEITNGGNLGIGETRVGSGGSASSGAIGCLIQTGGTLTLSNKLFIGRYGTSTTNPNEGKGFYTISGGTLTYLATSTEGGLYVGAAGSGGVSEGTFTIAGKQPKINLKKIYIGGDGKKCAGNGIIEFELDVNGVSPAKITDGVYLDMFGEQSKAMLTVNADASAPKTDIMLIETEGGSPVNGVFDTANGNPAPEGAEVVLKAADGSYSYKLTYTGGSGNDIMLKFVKFTPAANSAAAEPNTAKK